MTLPLWKKNYPQEIDWNQNIETGVLFDLIDQAAAEFPDRPAMKFMGVQWTYQEIKDLTDKAAKGFQKMGVEKGTKVALVLPNSPYYLVNYFGILKAGGTVVNMNPLYTAEEMVPILEDSETDLIVSIDKGEVEKKVKKAAKKAGVKKHVNCRLFRIVPFSHIKKLKSKVEKVGFLAFKFNAHVIKPVINIFGNKKISFDKLVDNKGDFKAVTINPKEDVALFQFTSGTTGRAKAVMLTHENLTANVSQSDAWFTGVERGKDKMMAVIPFFHVLAMTVGMNLSIKNGMEIIAHPVPDMDEIMESIDQDKPTHFPGIPQLFAKIMEREDLDNYDLSSLKFCLSGGGPLPPAIKKAFSEKLGFDIVEGYGLSEASPVVTCSPIDGPSKIGSIGLPLPGTDVQLRDIEDGSLITQPNVKGELCVKGPQVMKGYFNNNEATQGTMYGDDVLRTGDVAIMDEDGFFYIVDRIKDLIITRGNNVYPTQVEKAIYDHEAVAECIVAGMPDEKRGERVTAWIRLKEGHSLTKEELTTFLKDKLTPYKMPKQIEFETEPLPTNTTGKHLRREMVKIQKEREANRVPNKKPANDHRPRRVMKARRGVRL